MGVGIARKQGKYLWNHSMTYKIGNIGGFIIFLKTAGGQGKIFNHVSLIQNCPQVYNIGIWHLLYSCQVYSHLLTYQSNVPTKQTACKQTFTPRIIIGLNRYTF